MKAKDEAGYKTLIKIATESSFYDFWTVPRGVDHSVDVMVPPAFSSEFVGVLDASNIQHSIKISDVQAYSLITIKKNQHTIAINNENYVTQFIWGE